MRLRRLRKVLAWGTFCPACRTVFAYPSAALFCDGGYGVPRHSFEICDVVTVLQ